MHLIHKKKKERKKSNEEGQEEAAGSGGGNWLWNQSDMSQNAAFTTYQLCCIVLGKSVYLSSIQFSNL